MVEINLTFYPIVVASYHQPNKGMKKLNVVANKSFYHGFILNEQELRRFNDLIQEQLKKEYEGEIENNFSVTFENGVVAETNDLEEILSLENSGSGLIIELKINSQIKDSRKVVLEFTNADSNNISTEISVRYNISGLTRDWVFITSSLIDERIKKIRRWNINYNSKNKRVRYLGTMSVPFAMTIGLLFTLFTANSDKENIIKEIREDYESGKLTEPIEALLRIQESGQSLDTIEPMKYALIGLGAIFILLLIIYFYFLKLYPVYNFCWGDYLESFKKKESLRKTINTVVIIGLVISIVGGVIANQIGK